MAQQSFISSTQNIVDCNTNCLSLQTPDSINLIEEIFINEPTSITFASNPAINQNIVITDIRNTASSFTLNAQITPLQKVDDINSRISFTQIGLATFNQDISKTVDYSVNDSSVVNGLIDTNTSYNDIIEGNIASNEFTFFSGTNNILSDNVTLVASDVSAKINAYSFGIAGILSVQEDDLANLKNGTYQLSILYTLSSS